MIPGTWLHSLYLLLLITGAFGFGMHLYAQWRFVRVLRSRHANQWRILTRSDKGRTSRMRIWAHLQRVLRSNITEQFDDAELSHWHRIWRRAPWLAWPCWIGVLLLQATLMR